MSGSICWAVQGRKGGKFALVVTNTQAEARRVASDLKADGHRDVEFWEM